MEDTLAKNVGGTYNTGFENKGDTGNIADKGRGMMDDASQRAKDAMDRYGDREPKQGSRPEHREGPLARAIEQRTAQLPSDTFLWAAVGSMGLSLALELMGEEKKANFVGHWAPTLLIFGLYNKIVKLQGSDGA